jgi:hypothetical protein
MSITSGVRASTGYHSIALCEHLDARIARCRALEGAGVEVDQPVRLDAFLAIDGALGDTMDLPRFDGRVEGTTLPLPAAPRTPRD